MPHGSERGTVMDFLQYAKDKHEIEQVYILYCDLVDHKQFDGMTAVFTMTRSRITEPPIIMS
jgi:hypothetical protein